MSRILVAGGAGYIGSHMVKMLGEAGDEVVTYDNLSSGHRDAVLYGTLVEADLADSARLGAILATGFDAVMHFASCIQVGESVRQPGKYYRNNVANTLTLLAAMVDHGIRNFIFSSTAAVFGEPQYHPIDEAHPRRPISPYGKSKSLVEEVLPDFDRAHGLRSVCLRYFNAAGADPSGALGERHDPETHLIPLVLQAASGRRSHIDVYGRDYPTPDGTCVRDYVHVEDLCRAHLLALRSLARGGPSSAYNLGNGDGFSVQAVIDVAQRVTGRPIRPSTGQGAQAILPASLPTRPAQGPNSIGSLVMPIWKASSPTPGTGRHGCRRNRRSQAGDCSDSSRAAAA
jgi:UDP-glucose 4-epimerase